MYKLQGIYCSLKTILGTDVLKFSVAPVCSFHLKHRLDNIRRDESGFVFSVHKLSYQNKEKFCVRDQFVNLHEKYLHRKAEDSTQKKLVEDIYESCCEIDILFKINGLDITSKVVTESLKCGLSLEQITTIFRHSPKLIKNCNITAIFDLLEQLGFTKNQITKMLVERSKILLHERSKILDVFETLSDLGMPDQCVVNAINSYPEIMLMDPKELKANFHSLGQVFGLKQIVKVLNKTPAILIEDKDSVIEKCNYALEIMVVDLEQVITSSLLQHSLFYIRCRHLFLERAGLFKKFKQKKGEPNPNPPLKDIVDPSDEDFLKIFMPNATILDYKTFCKLVDEESKHMSDTHDLDDLDD